MHIHRNLGFSNGQNAHGHDRRLHDEAEVGQGLAVDHGALRHVHVPRESEN